VGINNEINVMRYMQKVCKNKIEQYPTTFDEDTLILDKELTENERNIVTYRR
jgi:hypothetical protein